MSQMNATIQALNSNGFHARYFASSAEARQAALEEIGGGSVGFGGSMTVDGMGLYETLKDQGNAVYCHAHTPLSEDPDIFLKEHTADVYVCSSNAITQDGKLVNIDGRGNRVGDMFNGPDKVIIIAGKNKIVPDVAAGFARIKGYAAGLNARRLNRKTPCAVNLKCADCKSPDRLCRVSSVIERPMMSGKQIHVYLVDEELGY